MYCCFEQPYNYTIFKPLLQLRLLTFFNAIILPSACSFSPLPPSRKNSNLAHREKMCRKMVKCKYKLRFYCSPFGLPPFNLFISNNNRQQKQPRRRSFKKTAFLLPLNFTPPYCKTNDFQSCPAGL